MKSRYDTDELFEIERTLVETIASSLNELNIDGTRKKVKEYFDDTLLPEVLEEMSVLQRCNKQNYEECLDTTSLHGKSEIPYVTDWIKLTIFLPFWQSVFLFR